MSDVKLTDQTTGHENVGHENTRQNCLLWIQSNQLTIRSTVNYIQTRNKSNDYFESLQYRQDVRQIAHYYNRKNLAFLYTLLRKSQ